MSFYCGWIGQRICVRLHQAVLDGDARMWRDACREFDRLLVLLDQRQQENETALPEPAVTDLAELLDLLCEDGGWWSGAEASEQRYPDEERTSDFEDAIDQAIEDQPFVPYLNADAPVYFVAGRILEPLTRTVHAIAEALGQSDPCRLGAALAGLSYRISSGYRLNFLHDVLDRLADLDMSSLAAENALRRELSLVEWDQGRTLRIDFDVPAQKPDGSAARKTPKRTGGFSRFRLVEKFPNEPLVLMMVFGRFDVEVPPIVSDAELFDVEAIKRRIRQQASISKGESQTPELPVDDDQEIPEMLHTDEAIKYLGISRRGLKRPEMALQRVAKNHGLKPVKVGGRNLYKREELDRVLRGKSRRKRRGKS